MDENGNSDLDEMLEEWLDKLEVEKEKLREVLLYGNGSG